MVMKGKMLAKRQAGIRHIRLPGKGLLGEEQGASHVRMPFGGIYPFASALPLRLSLLSALPGWLWCAMVLNPGVNSLV